MADNRQTRGEATNACQPFVFYASSRSSLVRSRHHCHFVIESAPFVALALKQYDHLLCASLLGTRAVPTSLGGQTSHSEAPCVMTEPPARACILHHAWTPDWACHERRIGGQVVRPVSTD